MAYVGTKLGILSTGEKFWVRTVPYGLLSCIREGDHLYKPANTDSIFVIKPEGDSILFIAPHWHK